MNQGLRLILAFIASALIMFVYYTFVAPPLPPQPVNLAIHEQVNPPSNSVATSTTTQNKSQLVPTDSNTIKSEGETVAEEKQITITTPQTQVVLSTKGAVLTSYELTDYNRSAEKNSDKKNIIKETENSSALFLGFKGYSALTQNKIFEVVSDEKLADGTRKIVLAWQNKAARFEKIFVFGGDKTSYGVTVDYAFTNLSDQEMTVSPYLETTLNQKVSTQKKFDGVFSFLNVFSARQKDFFNRIFYRDQKLDVSFNWEKFLGAETQSGAISWIALADRYFIFAMVPGEAHAVVNSFFDRHDNFLSARIFNPETTVAPHQKIAGKFLSYVGPKKLSELTLMNVKLEQSVDYGWFSILAVPILALMTLLHKVIPNWGLVILSLTFIIKLLLHPVNKKSMTSMKGMQQLQPKLKEIKDKFPNDKDKQNQQIMQLFKTHKVNPMGGCLPMILQMPIYIVLYKVLWNAIELYHAPFIGFYHDLSAPDPFFILPIMLGIFMMLQQKLTPAASVDPAQQKMMMFMPLMFSGFLLFLPVGLVLYIFVNTVMSVMQQFMMKRDLSFKDLFTGKWQPNGA